MTNISKKLRQLRELRNMSQQDLARLSGLTVETVKGIEDGRTAQSATVIAFANALGVTVRELSEPGLETDVLFPVLLDDGAVMPKRAHEDDAGFDLYSPKMDVVPKRGSAVIDTGVHVAIPKGYAGLLVSKSGLNIRHGLISDGLIDAGYTGSIRVKLYNLSDISYIVERGDKISQLVFIPIVEPALVEVTDLAPTERGDGGFGSTGK